MSDIGKNINGYILTSNFTTVGGGMCKWAFAEKDGKYYFIKEFLTPKYPVDGFPGSERSKRRKKQDCDNFEVHQKELMEIMQEISGEGGNIVHPIDFFRVGSFYYKVTEKVDNESVSIQEISEFSIEQKLILLKTLANSLKTLHIRKIIHGDLKPDNILIKNKDDPIYGQCFVGKLIDMDNSYLEYKSPFIGDSQVLVGTVDYYSPELGELSFAKSSDERERIRITTASDIFALGVIFHEYLAGKKPSIDEGMEYVWRTVALKKGFSVHLPIEVTDLIIAMLNIDPSKRPTSSQILERLKSIKTLSSLVTTYVNEKSLSIVDKVESCTEKPTLIVNMPGRKMSDTENSIPPRLIINMSKKKY